MKIFDIINELNQENGSNYKLSVLKKYKDNELLKNVLKMTYDRVTFTYGMTLEQIEKFEPTELMFLTFEEALEYFTEEFSTRNVTGHKALQLASNIIQSLPSEESDILKCIINRDLRINIVKTQINKIHKNLIVKPVYMRCGVYNEKTKSKISDNCMIQLKADGTYRDFTVHGDLVECCSRSGEKYDYPLINEVLKEFKDGHYQGEITVVLTDELLDVLKPKLEKIDKKNKTNNLEEIINEFNQHKSDNTEYILPRSVGNGLIKSDEVPHKNLKLELWDYVTPDEYDNAQNRITNKTPYIDRFYSLKSMISNIETSMVKLIPYKIVKSIPEALQQVSEWMNAGFEGGVLKDFGMLFRDGTSPRQLKMKLEIELDLRCTGYKEGTKGTKREGKIGSLQFQSDDELIKGYRSGFSDSELDEFTDNFNKYKDQIMVVQFNDLTKARGHDYYALSHPRFIEWRTDKEETDTLERAFELRDMAMEPFIKIDIMYCDEYYEILNNENYIKVKLNKPYIIELNNYQKRRGMKYISFYNIKDDEFLILGFFNIYMKFIFLICLPILLIIFCLDSITTSRLEFKDLYREYYDIFIKEEFEISYQGKLNNHNNALKQLNFEEYII